MIVLLGLASEAWKVTVSWSARRARPSCRCSTDRADRPTVLVMSVWKSPPVDGITVRLATGTEASSMLPLALSGELH